MVLGTQSRCHARSAPDESSLIPHPPGLDEDERHCLGSEGELSFAVYVLVTKIKEVDDRPPPATQIRRPLSSPFVPDCGSGISSITHVDRSSWTRHNAHAP